MMSMRYRTNYQNLFPLMVTPKQHRKIAHHEFVVPVTVKDNQVNVWPIALTNAALVEMLLLCNVLDTDGFELAFARILAKSCQTINCTVFKRLSENSVLILCVTQNNFLMSFTPIFDEYFKEQYHC